MTVPVGGPGARVALVTGAAQGIGLAVARRLAAAGHAVVLLDVVRGRLDAALASLDAPAGRLAILADVSREADAARAVAEVEGAFGRLDVLVNNAALVPREAGRAHPVAEMPLAEWEGVLAVNLTGAFLMSRAAVPPMRRGGFGRIVNMSSQGGRARSLLSGAAYGASKAGLIGFSRVLAGELGPDGITVNCVAPGRVDTPQSVGFAGREDFVRGCPVGRIGEPEDVAAAVAYLVSAEAGFVTGAVIDVNGGMFMP